jgi:hypothetical protein
VRAASSRQLDVLRWIAEGTPDRAWPDYTHRTTAKALQSRGPVKVRGHGPSWTAEITELGQRVLDEDPPDASHRGERPEPTRSGGPPLVAVDPADLLRNRFTADYDRLRSHVRERLAHYPILAGAQLYEPAPGHFQLELDPGGRPHLRGVPLYWPDIPASWENEGAALHRFSDRLGGRVPIWPRFAGSDLPAHPYLLWWMVLIAMAHYARYEPMSWVQPVNVDHSPEAIAVEHIGALALDELPELIHQTLVRCDPQV